MLMMLMMGDDDDADDRKNYINKLPNSRSTAPRAPNISSSSSSSSSSSLRELGLAPTHDVLASWREVWVGTRDPEPQLRKQVCESTPRARCSCDRANRLLPLTISSKKFHLAENVVRKFVNFANSKKKVFQHLKDPSLSRLP